MNQVHFNKIDEIIITHLNESKLEIFIAVAWITDRKIISSIEKCLERGVSVNILFYNDKINKIELFENIYRKGANIRYTSSLMHNKFCIIDNSIVINGSYNWTISAKTNAENIQVTISETLFEKFKIEFNRISQKSRSVEKHFKDNENDFNIFLNQIGTPIKYPVFFKLDINNKIKHRAFTIDSEYHTLDKLDHVYKLFYNKEDFIAYLKKVYLILNTNGNSPFISLHSNIKQEDNRQGVTFYGNVGHFLVIDIIKPSDIKFIKNISSENYIDSNFRFTNDKFVYFEDYQKDNILMIGFLNGRYKIKLQDKLLFMGIENTVGFNKVTQLECNLLNSDSEHISIIREVDDLIKVPLLGEIRAKVKFDIFVKISNFQFDYDYSRKVYKENQYEIEKTLLIEYRERKQKLEAQKITNLKNNNECYLATMVYNNVNHVNIIKLRQLRNEKLLNNLIGVYFIKFYYKTSPFLVKVLKKSSFASFIIKIVIEKIILKNKI